MSKKFDIFDVHTGKFIDEDNKEYNSVYEQFLRDLDLNEAEQEVVNRIMRQHINIEKWYDDCLD